VKQILFVALLSGVSTAALAADLPNRKAPAEPPLPEFTWTGFYLGAQAGYAFGHSNTDYGFFDAGPSVGSSSTSPGGFIGGLHMGYNWQVPWAGSLNSGFVLGLEGDLEGSSYQGSSLIANADLLAGGIAGVHADVFGSVRGRLGYAIDHTLIYATGGAAFTSFRNLVTAAGGVDGDWIDVGGWTVGGGVEYAINDHWSIRAEYRYDDYGHFNNNLANSTGGLYDARHHETMQRVEAGFSYKFNSTPPTMPVFFAAK
jgi:outer membrane immunogenic protein